MRSAPAALALAAVFLAAGCGSAPITVTGTIAAPGGFTNGGLAGGPGQLCAMGGGYSDIRAGAQVVVTDDAGKTIAVGQLEPGKILLPRADAWGTRSCVFPFTVQAPGGYRFYGIEVTHRGVVRYTAEQLRQPVEMSLGRG
ncbi:hypothetical protein [Nonomuraea angiospora]